MIKRSLLGGKSMGKKTRIFLLLTTIALLGLVACRQQEASPESRGIVRANAAYRTSFGEAPVPERGLCFARVGFYPLKSGEGRLAPVPLFLFRESGQLALLLGQLAGSGLRFPEASALYNPFPPGSSVELLSEPQGHVELVLKPADPVSPGQLRIMAAALAETAFQFDEVTQVRVLSESEGGRRVQDFTRDGGRIQPPGPPELLQLAGSWEAGKKEATEILAGFDRPVKVEFFRLTDAQGLKIPGEYFTSAFEMAVVVHPEKPSRIREGMRLKAQWRLVDRLGRTGEGTGEFELLRHEHGEETGAASN